MRKRTRKDAEDDLHAMFPDQRGDWTFLERILNHMDVARPSRKEWTLAFRMHFGLAGHEPMQLQHIESQLGRSRTWASSVCNKLRMQLRRGMWWDVAQWPKPKIPKSWTMSPKRVGEIATQILMWRYENTPTNEYLDELRFASIELGISEKEKEQFHNTILASIARKT